MYSLFEGKKYCIFVYYTTVFNNFVHNYREQLAIADFAKSLLVIPKTLSVNAAQDSSDLVAKLR